MAVEKAQLEILYKNAAKGKVIVPCMFNPETIKITRSNDWGTTEATTGGKGKDKAEKPTSGAAGHGILNLEFKGSNNGSMGLDLFFDTTDTGKPVNHLTDKIMAAMEIETDAAGASENTQNAQPPCVVFRWGPEIQSFKSVIKSATVTFKYFSSAGAPLRAEVNLDLAQYGDDEKFDRQNPTSGTLQPHRVHRVQPGETLDRISARYYRDATKWRMLAVANGIEDPLAIRPGSLITVPMLEAP